MTSGSFIARLILAGLLLIQLTPAGPRDIAAACLDPVPETFWGMHIHHAGRAWPSVPFGAWRLWDAGVAWPQLEPRRGDWDFRRLDEYVELAARHHVRVLLVVGLSPAWASSRPGEPSAYEPGYAAPPADLDVWRNYVRTVATRYKGRIHEYEVWNEPNFPDFFSGTVAEMVALTRAAAEVIRKTDPAAIVVSPSASGMDGAWWLKKFLRAGGAAFVDVIGYHFYVFPRPPEAMSTLINQVRQVLTQSGVSKPIWNTESGWGRRQHEQPLPITDLAPAWVARAYILNWLGGVQRFYWYSWDDHDWVTLEMTRPDGQPAPAAAAFEQVRSWLSGTQLSRCETEAGGAWVCRLDGARPGWIVWNSRTVEFRHDHGHSITDLSGVTRPLNGRVEVGPSPQFISMKK